MVAKILKLLCIVFSVVTVLLCGCAKQSASFEPLNLDFQADFTADYRGLRLAGSVTNLRRGVTTIRFTAPQTLKGLQIRCQGGEIALISGSASATADEPYLPRESFPSLLCSLLRAAGDTEEPKDADGAYRLALPAGEGTLTPDGRQLPESASVPGAALQIDFSHCEPIG